jgi:hypothetical protein
MLSTPPSKICSKIWKICSKIWKSRDFDEKFMWETFPLLGIPLQRFGSISLSNGDKLNIKIRCWTRPRVSVSKVQPSSTISRQHKVQSVYLSGTICFEFVSKNCENWGGGVLRGRTCMNRQPATPILVRIVGNTTRKREAFPPIQRASRYCRVLYS